MNANGDGPVLKIDLGADAYDRIKASIRDGELRSGDRLVEAELTARLGMSRTPVREALQRLEAEGLLSYEPRRGMVVTRPDHQMVMELYTMREILEGKAAALAAQHATDLELATLHALIDEEARLLGDMRAIVALNQRFHAMMYLAAHNRYLLRSLRTMHDTMALLPTMLGDPQRVRQAHDEHRAIVAALTDRDAAAGFEAAAAHIRSAQRGRLDRMVRDLDTALR